MTTRRRVCLLPPADLKPDSGSTLYSRQLARALAEAGCEVSVVCARTHEELAVRTILVPVPMRHPFDHHEGTPNAVFAEAAAMTARAVLEQWAPQPGDVIHAIYAGYSAAAAGLVSALSGSATVISELGRIVNLAAPREMRYRRLARLAFASADHVIAATADVARRIQTEFGVAAERLSVLPVPFDRHAFRSMTARTPPQPGAPLVITTICSCLTPEKGVLDLVEAFAIARRLAPTPLRLNIVGADPVGGQPTRASIARRVHDLGVEDDVTLSGYLPQAEIVRVLSNAHVCVDARRVGNFSSVIAEAMALECPLVASNVSSNTAFLVDGRDALLFEAGEVQSLASALQRLIRDTGLRARLSQNAAAWLARHVEALSIEAHAAAVIGVYNRVGTSPE